MRIQTGQGTISLYTLIAIWSVSAVVSLPGLAISPILGDLDKIFSRTTHLEIQMLTSLPSLLIIPFVLLAGKLSVSRSKLKILYAGLGIFFASGLACLFADSMKALIVLNALLGIGAGMVIPLSKGMIADRFSGRYRVRQLGISSSISNITMVLATSLTGWLATIDWHYPFFVYLLPGVSLLLTLSLRKNRDTVSVTSGTNVRRAEAAVSPPVAASGAPEGIVAPTEVPVVAAGPIPGVDLRRLAGLMLIYFFVTYAVLVISFNLPFSMQHYGMSSSLSGVLISLFFLAIMLPGFWIDRILYALKKNTMLVSLVLIAAGLGTVFLFHNGGLIAVGCFAAGLGYGIIQPLIYNKAVITAVPEKSTLALALVMSMNYLAILLCPFIVDMFAAMFGAMKRPGFPFLLNTVLTLIVVVVCYRHRNGFTFGYPENDDR